MPEDTRQRVPAGPDRGGAYHYFRPGNLTALRELVLLWLANRVEEGLQRYRAAMGDTLQT